MIYTATKSVCSKVDEYARLKIQIEDLTARAESIADDLKAIMTDKGIDQMTAGTHTVTYKTVTGKRLDTVALKKFFGEEALEPMMKETSTKRFSVK